MRRAKRGAENGRDERPPGREAVESTHEAREEEERREQVAREDEERESGGGARGGGASKKERVRPRERTRVRVEAQGESRRRCEFNARGDPRVEQTHDVVAKCMVDPSKFRTTHGAALEDGARPGVQPGERLNKFAMKTGSERPEGTTERERLKGTKLGRNTERKEQRSHPPPNLACPTGPTATAGTPAATAASSVRLCFSLYSSPGSCWRGLEELSGDVRSCCSFSSSVQRQWGLDAKLQMKLGALAVTANQHTEGRLAGSRSMLDLFVDTVRGRALEPLCG